VEGVLSFLGMPAALAVTVFVLSLRLPKQWPPTGRSLAARLRRGWVPAEDWEAAAQEWRSTASSAITARPRQAPPLPTARIKTVRRAFPLRP
jgi:hypothetical protein